MNGRNGEGLGALFVLVAAIAWSTAGLFTRVVATDVPTTLLWRSIFGGFSVLVISFAVRRDQPIRDLVRFSLGELIIAAISALGMMCFISAFFFTSIANVAFVYGAMPLITMLLASIVLGEKISPVSVLATTISFSGVALLVWGGQKFTDFLGIGLALLMTLFMAGVTVAAKSFPKADPMKAAYLSGFIAAACVAPLSQFHGVSAHDYVALALYGLVNVGLGFGVYLLGVARLPALGSALIGLIEIPLAALWAFLLFGESLTRPVMMGGILILLSSVIYLCHSARSSE